MTTENEQGMFLNLFITLFKEHACFQNLQGYVIFQLNFRPLYCNLTRFWIKHEKIRWSHGSLSLKIEWVFWALEQKQMPIARASLHPVYQCSPIYYWLYIPGHTGFSLLFFLSLLSTVDLWYFSILLPLTFHEPIVYRKSPRK